jgi:hypothetical protein
MEDDQRLTIEKGKDEGVRQVQTSLLKHLAGLVMCLCLQQKGRAMTAVAMTRLL